MWIACSTLCFGRYPLEEALRRIAELGFSKAEIAIGTQGPHLTPSDIQRDPVAVAHMLRACSASPAAILLDDEEANVRVRSSQFDAVCRLAHLCAAPAITVPASKTGTPLGVEVDRLCHLSHIAGGHGIWLNVETRLGTLTESPHTAVELCKRVPDLRLTLDPSHFLCGPAQGKNMDLVYPYVRHVHLRDSGRTPAEFQVPVGLGVVEYSKILALLERYGYNRLLTIEYLDSPDLAFSIETEVRKLKYLLESMIR